MPESPAADTRPRYRTQLLLFLATIVSTLMAGSNQPLDVLLSTPSAWLSGIPFAGTLMTILVFHEGGHYVLSRMHRVRASLPYFIPMPITPIGTMGAIIVMRSRIHHLRALIDIGAAGPIAGFALAVPALFIGIALSTPIDAIPTGSALIMGDSLLVKLALATVGPAVPEGGDVMLHPVAFAAWIGLFVTSLNLLPAGQLDGGHVLYSFIAGQRIPGLLRASQRLAPGVVMEGTGGVVLTAPRHGLRLRLAKVLHLLGDDLHRTLGLVLAIGLIGLGTRGWPGWVLWGSLLLVFGLRHPPTHDDVTPLDPGRRRIGWFCLLIFVLSFIPEPFRISG